VPKNAAPPPATSPWLTRAWSWTKKGGEFAIAQSDRASAKWAAHKGQIATAEALANLLLEEGRTAAQLKADLISKAADADPEKVAYIEMLLREVDGKIRTINVLSAAGQELGKLPPSSSESRSPQEMEEHWLDRFFNLTRAHNEPWRAALLAKALALETAAEGSISLNALWKIGTLQEHEFHAMAAVLDVCVYLFEDPMIINPRDDFYSRLAPLMPIFDGEMNYGQLLVILEEADLLHMPQRLNARVRTVPARRVMMLRYGSRTAALAAEKEVAVHGIFFTQTGGSLAKLYEPVERDEGVKNYASALERLMQSGCAVI